MSGKGFSRLYNVLYCVLQASVYVLCEMREERCEGVREVGYGDTPTFNEAFDSFSNAIMNHSSEALLLGSSVQTPARTLTSVRGTQASASTENVSTTEVTIAYICIHICICIYIYITIHIYILHIYHIRE